jgi:hypothetical protein
VLRAPAQIVEPPPEERESTPEPFAAIDPYTKGDPETRAKLGYGAPAPFAVAGRVSTLDVDELLGNVPIQWVQTEHFALASTLKTYRLQGDQIEATKLQGEIERLQARLGKFKAPRNEIDPWLRLHLYAQRLEEVYTGFCKELGLTESDLAAGALGPGQYLGQREKFLVLVLQQSSSLGRYTRRFAGCEQKFSYRILFPEGGVAFAVSAEALIDGNLKLDAALHSYVAFSTVANLCDAFRVNWGRNPAWFKYGLAHRFARRVDERWNLYEGAEWALDSRTDAWRWEPRVRGLVENDVLPPWEEMLAWKDWSEMDLRAHMMAWSCVDWLLERKGARPLEFLKAVTEPPPAGTSEIPLELALERQRTGLQAAFGAGVSELDAAWRAHVLRRYERK